MILVTGCGRSGTHYTARLLQQLGLDIPHEAVGKDGAASWKHTASGTFVYIGKNRETKIDADGFDRVLHQVRHPLKVIASMQTFSVSSWSYMAGFIDLSLKASPVVKGMQAWVGWNALAEKRAQWSFQIERLKDIFPEFCHHAGLPVVPLPDVPHAAKDSRTDRYSPLYWQDLVAADARLAESVRALALRYGYEDIATAPPPVVKPERPPGLISRLFGAS